MKEFRYEMSSSDNFKVQPTYMGYIKARDEEEARNKLHEKYGTSYPYIRSLLEKIS